MPPLEAFGRKWEIGSDDLVFPGIRNLLVRVPWFVGTIVVYYQNDQNFGCHGGEYIRYFLYGALAILHFMIIADCLLIANSMAGGVMDTKARRFVPFCLYLKVFLYFVEIGWNSLGTYGCVKGYFNCDEAPETYFVILGLIACNWLMLIFFFSYWMLQYDPYGASNFEDIIPYDENTDEIPITQRVPQWERRLKLMLCCVCKEGRSMDDVYSEGARNLAFMFVNSGLVASDVVVGGKLSIMKTELDKKRLNEAKYGANGFKFQSSINYDPAAKSLKIPSTEEWNSIPRIIHFLNYALAIFTLPAAYHFHRGRFLQTLCAKTQCCSCLPGRRKYPVHAENDNCCYAKTAAMTSFLKDEDIAYASYNNSQYCCPFYIAMDHPTKTIFIVIRGSFSTVDFLIDVSSTPVPMDIPGLPSEFKAHQGILKVAKTIKQRIDKLEILQKLKLSHPDYTILTTGISLGAGVSTILSMMLRLEFPDVKCLAFAVPGATVSLDAAEYCDDFLTSIVYGDDMIPRFGFPSLKSAVNDIKYVLSIYNIPKYRIQLGMWCSYFAIRKLPETSSGDEENGLESTVAANEHLISYHTANLTNERSQSQPAIFKPSGFGTRSCSITERLRHYPPGKILYIYETPLYRKRKHKKEVLEDPRWEVKWAYRTEFNEMIYSKRMISDHLPYRLLSALKYFAICTNSEKTNKQA